jgi:phosphoserine phosphatase
MLSFYLISSCPPKRAIGKRRGFLILRQDCQKTRRLKPRFAGKLKPVISHRAKNGGCKLAAPGWNSETRLALEKLIRKGAGKGLPAVFDFDNTILHGDIHEATLGMLVRSGRLTPARLSDQFAPTFHSARAGRIDLQSCADIVEYYNELLAPTMHGENDPTPKTTGYAWAIEVLGGLRLSDVVEATREVCELARSNKHDFITITPGKTVLPVPRFYPEMVELLAELIRHEFDIWIISASNVWSVRWMVLNELNPRLRDCERGIAADHVIGAATLLADEEGRLYKDAVLVRENAGYAAMKAEAVGAFRLTSRLEYPLPAYSGKVACIFDAIGRQPYLCAGDGPSDHAMLAVSQHRLWIAPLNQANTQHTPLKFGGAARKTGWMIQASSATSTARFSDRAISSRWLFSRPDFAAESSTPCLNSSPP